MRMLIFSAVSSAVLVTLVSASPARAGVYRCVLNGGHVSYQQFPCSMESKPMDLEDRQSGWSALRPGEKDLLNRYRNKAAARRHEPSGHSKRPAKESRTCWKKRRQLEAVRSRLHRGYKLKEADELHRKQNDYEDYLRQFCASP